MSALPILCYHNVAEEARFKLLYVSPDSFERQLWSLQRLGLRGVSMGEGMVRLRNGTARGCVALTFDDGYADTVTTAAPLMKKYGFRATCYIVAGALGTYNHWDADYLRERKPLMSREQLDQWLALGMEVGSRALRLSVRVLHGCDRRVGATRGLFLCGDGPSGGGARFRRLFAAAAHTGGRCARPVEVSVARCYSL